MAERLVGTQAPRFEMEAVMPNQTFGKVSLEKYRRRQMDDSLFLSNGLYICLSDRNRCYFRSVR